MNFLLSFILLILMSCNSPLLDHKNEELSDRTIATETANREVIFKNTKLSAEVHWVTPIQVGECSFLLTFNQTMTDEVEIIPWMPSMGHGTSPVTITQVGQDEFQVSEIFFIMSGLWDIKIQIKKAGAIIDEAIISYRL